MGNLKGFNAGEVEPQKAFDPIPAGKYLAIITASEMKTTQAGTGEYLSLTFEIIDDKYKNRKLFANLNLNNPNSQAVEIARSELSAICRAIGILTPDDSAELHNQPLVIKVGVEKRKDTQELQNRIKGYESKDAAKGNGSSAAGTPATKKPWER